jgi:hypothetical protein
MKINIIRIVTFLLLVFIQLFNIACPDVNDDNKGFKDEFQIHITFDSNDATYTTHCTESCTWCEIEYNGQKRYLDPNKYKVAYDKCNRLPSRPDPVDERSEDNASTGKISFVAATVGNNFGFDDRNEFNPPKDTSYVSVASNCSTNIGINVASQLMTYYKRIKVKLPTGNIDGVSFSRTSMLDSIDITNGGVNNVKIYTTVSTTKRKKIDIQVFGISDPSSHVLLAGSGGNKKEDMLQIVCYDTLSAFLWAHPISSPSYDPNVSVLKQEINSMFKQAVLNVDSIVKQPLDDTTWDKNQNHAMDIPWVSDSIPPNEFYLEAINLIKCVESTYSLINSCGCLGRDNQELKSFILNTKFNVVFRLMDSASAGTDTIVLQYTDKIEEYARKPIQLSSIDGKNLENIQVNNILWSDPRTSQLKNRMAIKLYNTKLSNNHPKGEYVSCASSIGGFALPRTSCTFIGDRPEKVVIPHELLHTLKFGHLNHPISDTMNVMYKNVIKNYFRLRYRELITVINNTKEKQWDDVRR